MELKCFFILPFKNIKDITTNCFECLECYERKPDWKNIEDNHSAKEKGNARQALPQVGQWYPTRDQKVVRISLLRLSRCGALESNCLDEILSDRCALFAGIYSLDLWVHTSYFFFFVLILF